MATIPMTSAMARAAVSKIEDLQDRIEQVYAAVRSHGGMNDDSVIRDAIEARKAEREAASEAAALIASFDFVDEESAPAGEA